MSFSDILQSMQAEADGLRVSIPEDWLQGRSAYGGLQAALALQAMRRLVPAEVPLRTLQTTFIAPAAGTLRIDAQVLREGKSAIHAEARMFDGAQLVLLVVAVFGRSRESKISIPVAAPTPPKTPAQAMLMPYLPGITPAFTQHLEFRWTTNNLPFSGAKEPRLQVYVRLREPPAPGTVGDDVHLVMLADAPPSPGMTLFRGPVAGSSLTWTLELLDEQPGLAADDHLYIDNEVTAARHGYFNQTATLWRGDGSALALSRQSFVIFG